MKNSVYDYRKEDRQIRKQKFIKKARMINEKSTHFSFEDNTTHLIF